MDLKETLWRIWTWFTSSGGLLWTRKWNEFHKTRGIFWLSEQLL